MDKRIITVVTGFGRCGTTLMMRMLHHGGMPVYADTYVDYEAGDALALPDRSEWLEKAEGMAIKILEPTRFQPPKGLNYKFILMQRNSKEQAKSQVKLLKVAGESIGSDRQTWKAIARSIEKDMPKLTKFLNAYRCPVLIIKFEDLIRQPAVEAAKVSRFCGGLDEVAMRAQVIDRPLGCLPYFLDEQLALECEARAII